MKKIVELLIDWDNTDFDDLGVDVMSFVDKPAIGIDFLAFSEEKFVERNPGESENDFIGRCIPVLKGEGYDDDQAAAICYSSFDCEDCFDLEDACWPGYEAIGMKNKNGKKVPNCVPIQNQKLKQIDGKEAYDTIEEALAVAKEMGCEGYHEHEEAGVVYYMPCESHDEVMQEFDQEKAWAMVIEMAEELGETVDYEKAIYVDTTKTNFENIGDYVKGIGALDILGRQGLDNEPETKYRYAGSLAAQRNFCKAMVRMNKLYTRDEINEMNSRINTGFRHRGQAYSIFDFKGGVYCNHYWEELEVYKDGRETVIMSKGRASGRAGQVASASNDYWRYPGTFAFSSDDEMIVTGPAMVPQQLILRKDEMGNPFHVYFSKDTIKKIARKFFEYNKQNNTDINHDDNISTSNTLLESWIVEDPKMDKSTSMGFNVPAGTWMASYKINDEYTWNQIKNGELNGYSIAGNFLEKAAKL